MRRWRKLCCLLCLACALAVLCALVRWLGDCRARCSAGGVAPGEPAASSPAPLTGRALRLHRRDCEDTLAALADLRRVKASVKEELVRLERDRAELLRQIRASQTDLAGLLRYQRQLSAEVDKSRLDLEALRVSQEEAGLRNLPVRWLPLNLTAGGPALSAADPPLDSSSPAANCGPVDCFNYGSCGLVDAQPRYSLWPAAAGAGPQSDAGRLLNASRRILPAVAAANVSACIALVDAADDVSVSGVSASANLVLLLPPTADRRHHLATKRPRAVFASQHQPIIGFRPGWDLAMPAPAPYYSASRLWAALPPLVPARRSRLLAAPLLPGANSIWWRRLSPGDRLALDELRRLCCGGTNASSYPAPADAIFCPILVPVGGPLSTRGGQRRLLDCLLAGSVPVILGDLLLPLADLLEPLWRGAVIRLPRARASELQWLLATYTDVALLEMRRQGRLLLERHLGTWRAQAATLLSLLNRRLGLPGPPATGTEGVSALVPGHQRLLTGHVPSYFDETQEYLGPVEPPLDSALFQGNFTAPAPISLLPDPLLNYPSLPHHPPPPPTEAQFRGSAYRYRPIDHSPGTGGLEFSRAIGGNLPTEQFTAVVLSYNREAVLVGALSKLAGLPYLHSVLVVWNGEQPPNPRTVWPKLGVPLRIIRGPGNSLNNRFLPWSQIRTEAVLSLDDDVYMRQDELVLAFRVWREHRDRIVGFPARFHAWSGGSWQYNSNQTCQYSMVLTGAAFLHVHYLHLYSYWLPAALRREVDRLMNCEDILMNFLVSHVTRRAPIKVTTRWSFPCFGCSQSLYKDESHFVERSHCINYFSGMFGYNSLLYSQFRADSVLFKTRLGTDKVKCFKYV